MTSRGTPFTSSVRPTIPGSSANASRQNRAPSMIVPGAPGESSDGRKIRPATGRTRSNGRRPSVTPSAGTTLGSNSPVTDTRSGVQSARSSSVVLCVR